MSRASLRAAAPIFTTNMRWAVGGWSFFIAENTLLSENREAIITAIGNESYHTCYGTLSTAALASIAYGFRRVRGASPLQWTGPPPMARVVAGTILSTGGMASLLQMMPTFQVPVHIAEGSKQWSVRCPFDFQAKDAGPDGEPHGMGRISRHSGFWTMAALCGGSAMVTASVPQAACLAMPTLVAMVGGAHQDSRFRRGMGGYLSPEADRQTSNIPFYALAMGRQEGGWAKLWEECKGINLAAAVCAGVVLAVRRGR